MRVVLLIFLLIGYLQSVAGQAIKRQHKFFTPEGNPACFYIQKYSAAKRSAFYPFNIADTIKLVSFRYQWHNYPIGPNRVVDDSLVETKILTKAETSQLTDILYNNFYKQQPNYGTLAECFYPRNAILFVDKSGALKDYILLCFQCSRYEKGSVKINFGDECTEKMEHLRQFFVAEGLRFGTDLSIASYVGESGNADIVAPAVQ